MHMARVCERCKFKENPDGMNFCGQCGAPLGTLCPRCGLQNSPERSVCERCSAPLPAFSSSEEREDDLAWETAKRYLPMGVIEKLSHGAKGPLGERRDVTVLFADLCDYTALSESFDPELVYGMLNAILDVLIKEIHRFEGVINQFRGDGLMATFGLPLAHENDPERAVRAGLNMQKALRNLNRELEPRLGVTIKMRIGINHGEVIAGSIGSEDRRDFTIIGSAVNLGARLEHAAESGSVLISKSVYQRTRKLFEFQAQPRLELKGIAKPVENWKVLGPKTQPARVRGLEGLSARMVGRDKELTILCHAADALMSATDGALILVTGEAGIGKSRLISEFKASLDFESVAVLEGACQAHTATVAYSLFASLLENYLQLPTSTQERRAALESWLLEHLPRRALTVALFLMHLLDLPMTEEEISALQYLDPSQIQRQVFVAVRDLLLYIAKRQPTLIILEDLHWIDNTSLELLAFLAPIIEQAPIILCGISRPLSGQAAPKIKDLGTTRLANRFVLIELNPLSIKETDALLADLLTIPSFPATWRQTILNRVRGNPFFLEEFVRILVDQEYITLEEKEGKSYWAVVKDVEWETSRVPQTLQELITTRIDRLPEELKHVLTCAAVLGQGFNQDLLAQVIDSEHRSGLDNHLQSLYAYDFISPQEMAGSYAFKHVIVQETVYSSLLEKTQREYHRRAGKGLESLYADKLDEYLEQLAFHYGHSGLAAKAVPYLTQAASRDARRYANDEALQYFQEALTLLPSLPPAHQPAFILKIVMERGDIYLLVGRYADARVEYWQGLGILHSPQLDSTPATASLSMKRKMGVCHERQGDYAQAMLWYQLALTEIESQESLAAEYTPETARLYSDVGWLHFRRNELDDAEIWLSKALQLVEDTDQRRESATIHNRMGGVWFQRGDLVKASQEVAAALVLYEQMGDLQGTARSYANLGVLAETQGQWKEAAICFRRSLETHEQTGDIQGATIASGNLGVVHTNLGDISQAKKFLERSLQCALATDDNFNTARAYQNLGRACLYAQEWSLAKKHLGEALTIYEELEDNDLIADTRELLGEVALGMKNLDEAQTLATKSLEMARQSESGRQEREARAWRLMGMVQRAHGHLDQARVSFLKSQEGFSEQGNRLELGQVMLELAHLYLALDQEKDARQLAEECQAICQAIGASLIDNRAADFLAALEREA